MATTTRGGIDVLNRKRTSDEEEKFEPKNDRESDVLNEAIAEIIGYKPAAILNQQFEITHPLTRPDYITFDRCYPQLKLLIDFFGKPVDGQADREGREADTERHRTYAITHGYKYLPIYDGLVEPELLKDAVA